MLPAPQSPWGSTALVLKDGRHLRETMIIQIQSFDTYFEN